MTRECTEDFGALKSYVGNYAISASLEDPSYVSSLKRIHRHYFAAISWHSELAHSKGPFQIAYANCNDEIIIRLGEVVSDLGSCVFNWINGNYKASKIILRVCIESFIRATSAVENKDQLTEKNVYNLFDVASSQAIFASCKSCYEALHADYKMLCADVHTATLQNMQHLTSLAELPAFEKEKSESAEDIIVRASSNINSAFCIMFNRFYHSMHHRNKENILNGVARKNRPLISGMQS